jgi:tetratricopeptide (TPR) repeat protein
MRAPIWCTAALLLSFAQSNAPTIHREMRPSSDRTRSATGDALDRYASGDYDRAVATLATVGGFNVEQADVWIRAAGPAAAARRRLAASTLVLEVIAAKDTWPSQMVEWACDGFRNSGPPQAGEELWMRASIALAEADTAWLFLTSAPFATLTRHAEAAKKFRPPDFATEHLAHVRDRFPDSPYVVLAEATAAEVAASEPAEPGATASDQTTTSMDRLTAIIESPDAAAPDHVALLKKAADALETLKQAPHDARAEAALRLGFIRLRLGEPDRALPEFAWALGESKDPYVRYLAYLFTGWTHAHEGRVDAAVTAYRGALDERAHARAASSLLTTLLLTHDRPADAEALADQFLAGSNALVDDPWRSYLQGDARSFNPLIDRLRELIR